MRKYLKSNSEVAHFWANQSQSKGRTKSMFFEGVSIFSYGHHYEAGRLVEDDHGKTVVLTNNKMYSVTTSKHLNMIQNASSQFPRFSVKNFNDYTDNMNAFLTDALYAKEGIFRARKEHFHNLEAYKGMARRVIEFYDHFKKSIKLKKLNVENKKFFKEIQKYDCENLFQKTQWEDHRKAIDNPIFPLSKKEIEKYKAKVTRAEYLKRTELEREPELEKARIRREEFKREKELKENAESIKHWREGGYRPGLYNVPTMLRLNKDRDRVETSRGAEISVKMALKLWSKIQSKQSVNGFDFGPYQADSLKDEVLTVGCHRIPMIEIKGIAIALGVR